MTAENTIMVGGILLAVFYVLLGRKRPGIAVITAPILCAGFVLAGSLTGDDYARSEAMALAPVILLATLITVLVSGRKLDEQQWPQKWARFHPLSTS